MQDLSHISKQIQKNTAAIDEARRQAVTQRLMADQKSRDGGSDASYYEQQALHYDQKANDLENEIEQLNTERERVEQRISDLQSQRDQVARDHTDRLSQIDNELNQLRGSAFML